MSFWKWLWKNPKRAYQIGVVALLIGMALFLVASRDQVDAAAQAKVAIFAAGCFAVWSLMFSLGAMSSYAAIVEEWNEKRFKAIEEQLNLNHKD